MPTRTTEAEQAVNTVFGEDTKRARGWRNLWYCLKPYRTPNFFHRAGETFWGVTLHPNQESARTGAQGWLQRTNGYDLAEYIDSFEVDQ